MRNLLFILLVPLILSACGTPREGVRTTFQREVLTAEEIAATHALTAYEAIRSRRPEFLTPQGPKSFGLSTRSTTRPSVYLNGIYYGDLETLKTMTVDNIKEIRFINAKDATLLYGTGHVAGVILVTTSAD